MLSLTKAKIKKNERNRKEKSGNREKTEKNRKGERKRGKKKAQKKRIIYLLINQNNMRVMLNDAKHPFGHGYCLAMALLGKVEEWNNLVI